MWVYLLTINLSSKVLLYVSFATNKFHHDYECD